MPLISRILLFIILFSCFKSIAQPANNSVKLPPLQSTMQNWVDSTYDALTLDQKIGQLFMIAAYSGGDKYNQPLIEKLIKENGIGGLIFMQGSPSAQIEQTNKYQRISNVPLLIGMDAEWGLGMRLTGVKDYPRQLMLGAMQDSTLVYKMASAIADQCRRMGVHINFAPVIDINNNPENPVINFRSFGENKVKVANYGIQYMRGLQDNGIIACAKHFPGHGDTDVDSHKDLPEINKTLSQLEQLELVPFQKLIDNGIQSMMIAHLQMNAIDKRAHTPATLSEKIVTDLLKTSMHFNGLIFTDALNMQGVAKFYEPGEIDLKAFAAGNDVLLFSQDVSSGIAQIKNALQNNTIPESRLEESVRKILAAKYNAGLHTIAMLDMQNVNDDLNQYQSSIRKQIAGASITLLNDPYQVIDNIKNKKTQNIVYVGVGTQSENTFSKTLQNYGIKSIYFAPNKARETRRFIRKLKNEDAVIVGIHNMSGYPTQNFGLNESNIKLINQLAEHKNTLNVLFGNPYAVKYFCDASGMLVCYDEADETQEIAAMIISSQLKANGKLPVSVCANYKQGDGIVSLTNNLGQIKDIDNFKKQNKEIVETPEVIKKTFFENDKQLQCCVNPAALGINNNDLNKLDDFLLNAIKAGAFPGCRILAAKDGKVFYDKAFGYLTQEKDKSVDINTVYDLASVTKVASTTMAIMKLYDQDKLDLNDMLGKYLNMTKGTDKEYLKIKDILMHQAGLKSWIPFYKETVDAAGYPLNDIYANKPSKDFTKKVCGNLYMRADYIDTMWKRILTSPLENRGKYVYSDLDFIFLQKVVETITNKSLDQYVYDQFYKPLGMSSTAYNPKFAMPNKDFAPTEEDTYFRHQKIQGYVHDMGAAMFGGVCGHAGLFSTPNDLGILFQMLLNGGVYDGRRYFKQSTVDIFTSKYSTISRRGLGFDKPESSASRGNPCSNNASLKTFGHQGFTGTCVWSDPTNGILFIFLSNRTYPSAQNKLINSLDIREKAQTMIYSAIGIAPYPRK